MKLIENASKEKLRGGFYTPEAIAKFILKWAVNGNRHYDVLEPSCGDGVFLEQIKSNKFEYHSVKAIELDPIEAEKAKKIKLLNTKVINSDFYDYFNSTSDKFDLVIGNPPYIRYQYFDKKQREESEKIFKKAGFKFSRLMNSWVSFVVGSSLLLKEKGKIGFVLPAEILQVSYAKQLRTFLARFYNKISIVSFRKLVFDNIQQEVVLLLCEKNPLEKNHLIEHLEVKDTSDLETLDVYKLKTPQKKIDFKSNKWTFYFLNQEEINFLEKLINEEKIKPLGHFAKVEVGITMGSNEFFTVPSDITNKYNLSEYAKPMVGRSVQVNGNIFTRNDWKNNINSMARAYFIQFPSKKEMKSNKEALKYLQDGENRGIHKGYKTGIRNEWQIVPSAWVSEALFLRRNNIYPKFVINEAKAYTTDTMHRVSLRKDRNVLTGKKVILNALIASYYNSLSLAFAEISGRSHGGGVLELMPSEVESILIPYKEENEKMIYRIDKMMREEKPIEEILDITDKIVLKEGYGFTDREIKLARAIWKKLMLRRTNRGKA